jgi:hypothetical protein
MPTIRVGDKSLPTLGVYCPECGWDCSGVAIEADHLSAQVYCNLCEAVSHPSELLEERTDGQVATWGRIDQLTGQGRRQADHIARLQDDLQIVGRAADDLRRRQDLIDVGTQVLVDEVAMLRTTGIEQRRQVGLLISAASRSRMPEAVSRG